MNWLTGKEEDFEAALALQPALQEKYLTFLSTLTENAHVPERILRLCRTRIEQIHGVTPDVPLEVTTDLETVALAIAERIPYQHHQVTDEEVAAVSNAFGDAGCVALLTALAFFDVSCRLSATLNRSQ